MTNTKRLTFGEKISMIIFLTFIKIVVDIA